MVCVFLAQGFEEMEALTPVDLLRRCEIEVNMVGVGAPVVTGAHGISVVCNMTVDQVVMRDVDAIVLPGGMPGTLNLEKSETMKVIIQTAVEMGIPVGAICAAPSILGHMGLLEGKKAVCFPGFEQELTGAEYTDEPVVVDGSIITSKGAGTACQFSFALAEAVCGHQKMASVRRSIQWQ